MTETNWTPGPWFVVNPERHQGLPGVDARSSSIVIINDPLTPEDDGGVHGDTQDEAEANARLIAAAPDLYEAGAEAVSVMFRAANVLDDEGWRQTADDMRERIKSINAALAKATPHKEA